MSVAVAGFKVSTYHDINLRQSRKPSRPGLLSACDFEHVSREAILVSVVSNVHVFKLCSKSS